MDDFNSLELRGARVTLCSVGLEDVDLLFDAIRDSREHLEKWLPWLDFVHSVEDERHIVEQWIYDMHMRAAIHLSIKTEMGLIGMVSTSQIDWTNQRTSIGYWVRRQYIGQNFATESSAVLIEYLFDKLRLHRVFIQAATENAPSNAVIRKLGFKMEGVLRDNERVKDRFLDHNIYGLTEDDFANLKQHFAIYLE